MAWWYGRVVPAPYPGDVGLSDMLKRNERNILSAAHDNIAAVGGLPAKRSSAATRVWEGPRGEILQTRSLDPNAALPVVDSKGRYFGHGAAGRQRMIAHAQQVMAGARVTQVPRISDVRDNDPFVDDIRERPHTPIIYGNQLPFSFSSPRRPPIDVCGRLFNAKGVCVDGIDSAASTPRSSRTPRQFHRYAGDGKRTESTPQGLVLSPHKRLSTATRLRMSH